MNKEIEAIKKRYFRKSIAYPKGKIGHFGDCAIYHCYVCDCGLLRDLSYSLGTLSPKEREKFERTMLPKGFLEENWGKHEVVKHRLHESRLYETWWKEAQDYANAHPVTKVEFRQMLKEMGFRIGEDK